ncbi:hypothetical protein RRG08_028478 [Elysia crispata]|uniref:Uncharacterized protein n=1 Tax=Elysia crispata TaxID=231223 RepID=A0AAE1AVE1_9GAST|nr:hypothetical protein RRG08_028478 [Elysia crispata]
MSCSRQGMPSHYNRSGRNQAGRLDNGSDKSCRDLACMSTQPEKKIWHIFFRNLRRIPTDSAAGVLGMVNLNAVVLGMVNHNAGVLGMVRWGVRHGKCLRRGVRDGKS